MKTELQSCSHKQILLKLRTLRNYFFLKKETILKPNHTILLLKKTTNVHFFNARCIHFSKKKLHNLSIKPKKELECHF